MTKQQLFLMEIQIIIIQNFKTTLNDALAMKTTIDQGVLKMKGLSGRKFRIMINSLIKL